MQAIAIKLMLTLQEIFDNPRIKKVTSSCPAGVEFNSLVNSGIDDYLRRGDFPGSVEDLFVCVTQGCVVMPRYVHKIRRINICNRAVDVENGWWRFMKSSSRNYHWQNWAGSDCGPMLQDRGTSPVFQDIQGDGRYIRVYTRCQADLGKQIQFFGTDNNGQTLMTKNPDGTWDQGITLVLAKPFVSSTVPVRHIDYVIKDQTECPINCYAYNAAQDVLEDLAQYDPTETNPHFARYHLGLSWPMCGTPTTVQPNCCSTKRGVIVRVKLKHIPAQVGTDLLPIDNVTPLILMIQAIKAREAGNFEDYQKWTAAAVKEGNLQISNDEPDEEFAASNNVLGPSVWNNQCF